MRAHRHRLPRRHGPRSGSSGWRGSPRWRRRTRRYGVARVLPSPNPHRSWVTAAGAVLDTAALRLAVLDIPWTPARRVVHPLGYLALREIAGFFGFDYDADPAPDDPISIDPRRVRRGLRAARRRRACRCARPRAGVARLRGLARELRRVLLALAALVMAPYAPWVVGSLAGVPPRRYRWGRRRRRDSAPRAGPRLSSHARNRSTPAIACIVRIELKTSNAWCAPGSST